MIKFTLDAMQRVVYHNDRTIVEVVAKKIRSENEGTEIIISLAT